jgi:flavodoxin I
MHLYNFLSTRGAELVGGCDIKGYAYKHSEAVVDGRFIGLVLDQHLQHLLTEQRIDHWLDEVLPQLLDDAAVAANAEQTV